MPLNRRNNQPNGDKPDGFNIVSASFIDGDLILRTAGGKAINGGPPPGGAGGPTALNDLTDVTNTSPVSGQVLEYNGSQWVNVSSLASVNQGDEDYWDSINLQTLTFHGVEEPNTATDPFRHNFVITTGNPVGGAPESPVLAGGSVVYTGTSAILSTNPTSTYGNSRAELRADSPYNIPSAAAPDSIINYAYHVKADVQVTALREQVSYVVGVMRQHAGAKGVYGAEQTGMFFQAWNGFWVCKVFLNFVQVATFTTTLDVTQRHVLEVRTKEAGGLPEFYANGVAIVTGFTSTLQELWTIYGAYGVSNASHRGVAIRDEGGPQTTIASITVFNMTAKRYLPPPLTSLNTKRVLVGASPSINNVLLFNGTNWVNGPLLTVAQGDDDYTDSVSVQTLVFNGIADVNTDSYPFRHNFVTTKGTWVSGVETDPAQVGGSITYVADAINPYVELSTNPYATVGSSKAEIRCHRPNFSGAPLDLLSKYGYHFKADLKVPSVVATHTVLAGLYRTIPHTVPLSIVNGICFVAIGGVWVCKMIINNVEIDSYTTAFAVATRRILEIRVKDPRSVPEFFNDGVVIVTGFTATPFFDVTASPKVYQGVAVRDDDTPQTGNISTIDVYRMTAKRFLPTSSQLDDLTDVIITTPAINHILVHNGTNFVNTVTVPTHTHVKADVTDFAHTHAGADITTGTVDYARLPTGTAASTVAIGDHTHTLDGLSDVTITSPTYRDTLLYNGSSWVNSKDEYVVTTFADVTLTNGTAAQSVFGAADDTINLPAASAWFVQGSYVIASGTVSHTTSISFSVAGLGSTGTFNFRVNSFPAGAYGTVGRAQDTVAFNSVAGGVINVSNGGALTAISFEGVYTCPDDVTFTPKLTFSAAPGGTNLTKVGSYIRLTRLFGADNTAADAVWT